MKIKAVSVVLCSILIASSLLAIPAQAASMNPAEGDVGTPVTISGLTVGAAYAIRWDGENHKIGIVSSAGSIIFTAPDACGGAHTVEVECPSGSTAFSGSFSILPSIDIEPNSGTVGTTITVIGTGFAAAESGISVTYGSTNVKTGITANDDGSWSTSFAVPSAAKGSHIVDASGSDTEADDVADKTFTVSPSVTVDPTSGGVGTSVTVKGAGFTSAETGIEVTYDSKEVRTGITANVNGSWSITFAVPNSTKGSHPVGASGDITGPGDTPDVIFTVSPSVSVDLDSGYVDDNINITGSGFASNEGDIKITFDGEVMESGLVADDNGYWATSLIIPAGVNGDHIIDAYGAITISADVSDAILNILPQVVLSPKSGDVGENVKVRGTGFSKEEDYTISYEGEFVVTGRITDSKGSFATSFEAPEGKSGECNVTATDSEDVTASAIFSVETNPPDLPYIASPKDGGRVGFIGDTKVTFDWTDVADPSGVYYALQISSQSNFAILLISHADLTASEYTLTEAESLAYGEYYWRVQAIDGAGNASDWTAPALIKAGYMTVQTFIIALAVIIGIIVLASVVPGLLRRRSKR